MIESGRHHTAWRLAKYYADVGPFRGREQEFFASHQPYEVLEGEGNLFTTVGVSLMLDLLAGAGGTVFNNANSRIGVGDSATAANASQTDLLGTNKLRKVMDATFPSRSGAVLTFESTFGLTDANFAWNEWGIFNAAAAGTMFNRKVNAFGTKPSSASWALQVAITVV